MRGTVFGATLVRNCYGLSGCWPPSTDLTGLPANGGFYFQAFSGSVALPAAGYDYNSVWTPLLAGLSPAGMAASLAALVRPCSHPASNRGREGASRQGARHVPDTDVGIDIGQNSFHIVDDERVRDGRVARSRPALPIFDTKRRTPKLSASFYRETIARNAEA